jgi:Tol biopolymer transport system component
MKLKESLVPIALAIGLAAAVCAAFALQNSSQHKVLFEKAKFTMETKGDLKGALQLFEEIIRKYPNERDYAAMAQLHIGLCHEKLGTKEAEKAFQKVVDNYPEQSEAVREAKEKLSLLLGSRTLMKTGKEFSMRRVYDGAGLEWGNALSSDGRYLVYTDWGSGDLAVMDLVTKKSRPLTNKGGLSTKTGEMGETSAFSPDNKKIAYGWYNKDKVPELWVIDFDGSDARLLWRDEKSVWIRPHEWSPDGRQILAITMMKEGPSQIVLVSAADGTLRVLREVPEHDPELDMSPDGRFVACSMAPDPSSPERDVFIVRTADGEISPLVAHAADDYLLGWAPDGRTLLFASNRTGAYGLWGIKVSDGQAQDPPFAIKPVFNYAEPVRLAPDGSLYYVLTESIMDIFTARVDPVTGKVQGPPKAVQTRYTGANAMAEWSPDGTHLAYLTSPGGFSGPTWPAVISILDTRTGGERQVKAKIGSIIPSHGLDWAPDGRSILVIGRTGEETAIYKIDVMTGASDPLVIIPKFEYSMHAAWSADGKSIFYPQGNPTRILRRDLDTGKDAELVNIPGPAGMPAVSLSPDGKWLAFTTKPEGENKVRLKIVPSAGGEVRELVQSADRGLILDLNWTSDGRYLWFRKVTPSDDPKAGSKFESWRISPNGGDSQQLELDVRGGGVRLHPDGRQIVYYNGSGRRDLWVMENFLPADKAKK